MADYWAISPLIFAVGLALVYSARIGICIVGAGLVTVALILAWAPGDFDNWYLAIFLAGVGGCLLFALPPRWMRLAVREAPQPTARRWHQFNLRRLLLFVAFISVLCAVAAYRSRIEHQRWYEPSWVRSWKSGSVKVDSLTTETIKGLP